MRTFLKVTLALVLLTAAAGGWLWSEYQKFLGAPLLNADGTLRVIIAPGQSFSAIAAGLPLRAGPQGRRLLEFHARRTGRAGLLQAGEYDLEAGWTADEVLNHIVAGKVVQHAITIVEGQTTAQMVATLRKHEALKHLLDLDDLSTLMDQLGFPGLHPEGQFLPDTYHFPRGTTDVAFLTRAHQALVRALDEEWAARAGKLPLKSPEEALILASIIEKETAVAAERTQVAGVFVRRLNKGMRLETDPTVIYGMGDKFDGNIRRKDLRRDTPYNTYTRHGLPPTPIALAGRASIRAALNPADGKAVFFVAKGDGTHHFSATYAEHRKAVRKYQIERHRKRSKDKVQ